jgi:hypothetical protein
LVQKLDLFRGSEKSSGAAGHGTGLYSLSAIS